MTDVETCSTAFQSTPSGRRETKTDSSQLQRQTKFQSTPSGRRETADPSDKIAAQIFQSTPSGRRETDKHSVLDILRLISIHSLRTEGDPLSLLCILHFVGYFNPLPPDGGRPLSTLNPSKAAYFNPLPPDGGRPFLLVRLISYVRISIHSLRTEGDVYSDLLSYISCTNFNPLPPDGGRLSRIMILIFIQRDFNPLPPDGGRQSAMINAGKYNKFQSTPSGRRETCHLIMIDYLRHISIHSLRTEGDLTSIILIFKPMKFQSTPSGRRETCGGRAGTHIY